MAYPFSAPTTPLMRSVYMRWLAPLVFTVVPVIRLADGSASVAETSLFLLFAAMAWIHLARWRSEDSAASR